MPVGPKSTGPQAKGPRLWLEPARARTGRPATPAGWSIRDDGGFKRRLPFGQDDRRSAEAALEAYLAEKRAIPAGERDPAQRLTADVLALYARDIAPGHGRPEETRPRIDRLLDFWAEPAAAMRAMEALGFREPMTGAVADVRTATCKAYVALIGKTRTATVDLEILRAALNYAVREKKLDRPVAVWLPPKPESRDRWLTRSEAAAIVWAAWRKARQIEPGPAGKTQDGWHPARHVARFALASLYTGTRKAIVLSGAFERRPGFGYIDLDEGLWHRRAAGSRASKKRSPPQPIPRPLLAHMRRWRRNGQSFLVEFDGQPIERIDKAWRAVVRDLGFDDVVIHTLRHTAITWALQRGMDLWDASGYFGVSVEVLTKVYAHHSPSHLRAAADIMARPLPRRQGGDRVSGTN